MDTDMEFNRGGDGNFPVTTNGGVPNAVVEGGIFDAPPIGPVPQPSADVETPIGVQQPSAGGAQGGQEGNDAVLPPPAGPPIDDGGRNARRHTGTTRPPHIWPEFWGQSYR